MDVFVMFGIDRRNETATLGFGINFDISGIKDS